MIRNGSDGAANYLQEAVVAMSEIIVIAELACLMLLLLMAHRVIK